MLPTNLAGLSSAKSLCLAVQCLRVEIHKFNAAANISGDWRCILSVRGEGVSTAREGQKAAVGSLSVMAYHRCW